MRRGQRDLRQLGPVAQRFAKAARQPGLVQPGKQFAELGQRRHGPVRKHAFDAAPMAEQVQQQRNAAADGGFQQQGGAVASLHQARKRGGLEHRIDRFGDARQIAVPFQRLDERVKILKGHFSLGFQFEHSLPRSLLPASVRYIAQSQYCSIRIDNQVCAGAESNVGNRTGMFKVSCRKSRGRAIIESCRMGASVRSWP